MRALLSLIVACVICGGLAGTARGEAYTEYYVLPLTDNVVTYDTMHFYECGHHTALQQEVHWGAITETWAYLRYVTYNYWVYDGWFLMGGRHDAYNGHEYYNEIPADMNIQYWPVWGSYAGSRTFTVNQRFDGGSGNYVGVVIAKHIQHGYYGNNACHVKHEVAYYRGPNPPSGGGGGCGPRVWGVGRDVTC